ncbi:MAG: hypothetical protein P4L86_14755, partial [Mycobacterium sp.]|nr:hypothetical protein [Mycobacterium sp.]
PIHRQAEFESEKSDHKTKDTKNWHQKNNHTPQTGKHEAWPKNNKQKPPNTLLSSQTTRRFKATPPTYYILVGLSSSSAWLFRPRLFLTFNRLAD